MRSRFFNAAFSALVIALVVGVFCAGRAYAGSTGNVSGTVVSSSGAPITGAHISATGPTGSYRATSDAHGFYSIVNMSSDTYTVTISAPGYQTAAITGANVFQDQTLVVNVTLQPEAKVLATITTTGQKTNLVQPNVTSDTYNVTAKQMQTILGDSSHHTLYDVLWRTPGITVSPVSGSPIIRGGINTELGWEFDEIPIIDRTVGFYTTELSTTGIGNVEVSTGGLSAQQGGSNGGVVNMVVKQGSYPGFSDATFTVGGPAYTHQLDTEYGGATSDNRWSWFVGGSFTNGDNIYGNRNTLYYECVDLCFDFVNTSDTMVNVHHKWGVDNRNDLQYVADVGVGIFRVGDGGVQGLQLAANGVSTSNDPNVCQGSTPCTVMDLVRKNQADAWYHWYTIQKLSFSHTINDRSYLRARVARSQNGYFFDEKWAQNIGEPYLFGGVGTFAPGPVNENFIWCYDCYYQDRHTTQTFWNADYANQLSQTHEIKFGVGYEYDDNFRKVANNLLNTDFFGNWPDYFNVTTAPTHIYSTYVSDHIAAGRWVIEPGLRWDMERYSISPVLQLDGTPAYGTAHAFNESFVSPRIAFTYQPDRTDVYRASYGHLGQFIGTAYAENFSVDALNAPSCSCHGPNFLSPLRPSVAKTWDFSWEHSLPNNVSLRVTPYWHNNDDYVVEYRVPASIDPNKPTLFTNGGSTHTKGVELAVSREVNQGLSAFFSFTYNDTKTNVVGLAGPYFGSRLASGPLANIAANNFVTAEYAAPWSSNLGLEWQRRNWDVVSNLTWSTAFPYGAGNLFYAFDPNGRLFVNNNNTCTPTNQGLQCLDPREVNSFPNTLRGPAWFNENLTVSHRAGWSTLGVTVLNVFNDTLSPLPSQNFNYINTDGSGNWNPSSVCGVPTNVPICYDVMYYAPNAASYPVNGYFRQNSLQPRAINFWWKVSM